MFSRAVALTCLTVLLAGPLCAQTSPPVVAGVPPQTPALQAEIVRKTSGRQLEASGIGSKPYVLTISYEYNGQTLTKQAEEGTTMILP